MFKKGYKKKEIYELFEFIDILLKFDSEIIEEKYIEEINQLSKTKDKPIISPFRKIVSKEIRKERDNEIAINMLKMNLDIKIVSQATGLTIKQLEELKKNMK